MFLTYLITKMTLRPMLVVNSKIFRPSLHTSSSLAKASNLEIIVHIINYHIAFLHFSKAPPNIHSCIQNSTKQNTIIIVPHNYVSFVSPFQLIKSGQQGWNWLKLRIPNFIIQKYINFFEKKKVSRMQHFPSFSYPLKSILKL